MFLLVYRGDFFIFNLLYPFFHIVLYLEFLTASLFWKIKLFGDDSLRKNFQISFCKYPPSKTIYTQDDGLKLYNLYNLQYEKNKTTFFFFFS